MGEIKVFADKNQLDTVINFIHKSLEGCNCSTEFLLKLDLVLEEIFINIAFYAYPKQKGEAVIRCDVIDDPRTIIVEFIDCGVEYNPLSKEDPDISLKTENRPIGGLGIFIVKKMMDSVDYQRKGGKNCLILKKKL